MGTNQERQKLDLMNKLFTTRVALLFLIACSMNITHADESTAIVEKFVEAFNQHDIDAMLELSDSELRWMSVAGQQLELQTSSKEELQEAMSDYFASTPSAQSKIRSISESGNFVHTVEEAMWTSNGMQQSQCSMAIYELKDLKISYVWYFAEHQCD